MDQAIFVERRMEVDGQEVLCRFYQPLPDGGDFRCDVEVNWPEGLKRKHALGVDSVQALLLAMQMVHVDLLASREKDGRAVSYLGDRSLGLPIANSVRDWDPDNRM